jgi:hypothetical protein
MNCLKKISFVLLFFLISLILYSPSVAMGQSTAYTSISLSPSPGIIYADATAITVSIDSGQENFSGGSFFLGYTGAVEYDGATGNAICTQFTVNPGQGSIEIRCTAAGTQVYKGVMAVLHFKATAAGSSVFTFTSTNPNTVAKSGGNYTLSMESNPNPVGGKATTLPDSGIFDSSKNILLGGVLLLFTGLFFNNVVGFATFLSAKAGEGKEMIEENRVKQRRNKLEKKY